MPLLTFTLPALTKASYPFEFFFKLPLHILVPSKGTLFIKSSISDSPLFPSVIVQIILVIVTLSSPIVFIFKLATPPKGSLIKS